jgi:hypothetical protein
LQALANKKVLILGHKIQSKFDGEENLIWEERKKVGRDGN